MKPNYLAAVGETTFSTEQITQQVQKIIQDSTFKYCEILKRFLLFIIEETLAGHAEWIKEYTIGVYVLNKPKNYKPEDSGIVRIHAGRLRRCLHKYYSGNGLNDPIHIAIPNGTYVPVFRDNSIVIQTPVAEIAGKKAGIAVLPFVQSQNKLHESFCDSLCMELSNEIASREKLSVVAYYIMRNLYNKLNDLREVASIVDAAYILTGNLHARRDKFRINIEMIEVATYNLVWSTMVEKNWNDANAFQLQDEIIKVIIAAVEEYFNIGSKKEKMKVIA